MDDTFPTEETKDWKFATQLREEMMDPPIINPPAGSAGSVRLAGLVTAWTSVCQIAKYRCYACGGQGHNHWDCETSKRLSRLAKASHPAQL